MRTPNPTSVTLSLRVGELGDKVCGEKEMIKDENNFWGEERDIPEFMEDLLGLAAVLVILLLVLP